MKCLIAVILICIYPSISFGDELEEKKIYRLSKTVYNLERTRDNEEGFKAVKNARFIVVDAANSNDYYVVRFLRSFDPKVNKGSTFSPDEEYKLPTKIGNVDVSKSVELSIAGPVSGPLIVPFKIRLDDGSVTGEATLGYYAGYRFESRLFYTNFIIPISPFIACGISQVTVEENGVIDNMSSFTWAVGLLIQNWADVNIGIVYGQDRTGETDWVHEGESWFSFMVGWDL